jgi:spore germination cell wall hydrolase CwlJ-like protein
LRKQTGRGAKAGAKRGITAWAWLALLIPTASCVPAGLASAPELAFVAVDTAPSRPLPLIQEAGIAPALAALPQGPGLAAMFGTAYAANAALPVVAGAVSPAPAYAFQGSTPLDQLRSLDCLAQAVYYEARSESEDGQRAVAQVVLNRVRHPAWPNSVCGVVYQGPMRVGGGCQFTFTCDSSLRYRAAGPGWDRARQIAAEALAGRTFAPVGLSTHYHTSAVFPSWAPRLVKTAVIGAHNFYRLPGLGGAPGAFAARYAGTEPLPRPAIRMVAAQPAFAPDMAAFTVADARPAAAPPPPSDIAQDARWTAGNLPESTIREEYRQSGQWRADAPAGVAGR